MRLIAIATLTVMVGCGAPRQGAAPTSQAAPAVEVPRVPGTTALRVDHAWVRLGKGAKDRAQGTKDMDRLRASLRDGGGFEAAWQALNVRPDAWHVGESESYPYDRIPPEARDLAVGTLSPVVPGDGGLHLFRILGVERVAADEAPSDDETPPADDPAVEATDDAE